MSKGRCKERSDGIAIVTLCVNRVHSYSRNNKDFYRERDIEMKNKETPIRNKTQRTSST